MSSTTITRRPKRVTLTRGWFRVTFDGAPLRRQSGAEVLELLHTFGLLPKPNSRWQVERKIERDGSASFLLDLADGQPLGELIIERW